ncbi:MAG: MFS transporter [Anaerolineae bacterium]|nr:MFS transporter [Anaerolineae bacterium]
MTSKTSLRPFIRFFIAYYIAIGAISPFLSLYLQGQGFDGVQIGLIFGLTPIVSLLAQPWWGAIADAFSMRRRLLTGVLIISGAISLVLPIAQGFVAVTLVMLALTLFRTPSLPIANAITLEALAPHRERYPQIRAWGSASFAITSLLVGWLMVDRALVGTIYLSALGLFLAALVSHFLPNSRAPIVARWWEGWDMARHNRPFLLFLLAMVTLQFTHPLAVAYLPLYLKDLGAPGWMIGAAWGIAAGMEVPLMALTPRLIRKYGAKRVLVGFTAAVPLRWALYSLIPVPLLILPLQFLHAMAAAAYYAAAITYVDGLVPAQWRATGQGFYGALSDSLGIGLGSLFFGWVYQTWGITQAFIVGAGIALVGWLMLVAFVHPQGAPTSQ